MSHYEIEPIDPNLVFIVTIDDKPLTNAASGEAYRFVRRVDAERVIAERVSRDEAYADVGSWLSASDVVEPVKRKRWGRRTA